MTNDANSYSSAATDKYTALKDLYSKNNVPSDCNDRVSFWKLGNTFDTMIDYLEVIDSSSANDVAQMVDTQLTASLGCIKDGWDGAWFDDFGWWSVAAQRALQKPFFKQDAATFQKIFDNCWPRFTNNAPKVWARHKPGTFEEYGPAVDGGVWNAYWTGTPSTYPGPKNGDPSNGKLVGIQNTVTNALYLMAAQRNPNAKQAAESEFNFLFTWLTTKLQTPYLWWNLGTQLGLVRERVSGFAGGKPSICRCPPDPDPDPQPGFQLDWAWTGDQGLMLGNFSDSMILQPSHRPLLLDMAKRLIAGVYQRLFEDGTVQNWTTTGCVPDGDESDYQVGSGVFWRNLLYVWKNNSELQTFLKQSDYQNMLRNSADTAANSNTGEASFEELANQTAVLVAATAILA